MQMDCIPISLYLMLSICCCVGTVHAAMEERDAGGLMADLLLMLLTAIFSLQQEEEAELAELGHADQGKACFWCLGVRFFLTSDSM